MKKIKKFIDSLQVSVEWETPFNGGKFEFSILHVIAIIAILIYIWVVL
jgi:hypothetical protein